MKRFLIDKIVNSKVTLEGVEHNHLRNVLRMQVGDEIILNCGDGFDYHAKVVNITKSSTNLEVISKHKNIYDPNHNLTVFQALVKSDNMSLIVQKCTELGVTNFVPFVSKFVTAKDKDGKADKLQLVSNQSTKQCKRSIPMHVSPVLTFNQMLDKLGEYDCVIFANESEQKFVLNGDLSKYSNVAIIVGSEGGFDTDEINAIVSRGAKSVTLGKRILRAETAAISLTSVVMFLLGEWNYD